MNIIQDLKKKSYLIWFLLASKIGEFFAAPVSNEMLMSSQSANG
jgi:hypothetical protein